MRGTVDADQSAGLLLFLFSLVLPQIHNSAFRTSVCLVAIIAIIAAITTTIIAIVAVELVIIRDSLQTSKYNNNKSQFLI